MKKVAFIFPLCFILAIFLFFRNNKDVEKDLLFSGNSFIEGVRIIHKKEGNVIWTLNAKRADIIESEDKARLNDVAMTIESEGMMIHALNGLYDFSNRNLNLDGSIVAAAKDYTITADSAEWDQTEGKIRTKTSVKIESKKFNIEGIGMETDLGQKVRILKNVKAIFF